MDIQFIDPVSVIHRQRGHLEEHVDQRFTVQRWLAAGTFEDAMPVCGANSPAFASISP